MYEKLLYLTIMVDDIQPTDREQGLSKKVPFSYFLQGTILHSSGKLTDFFLPKYRNVNLINKLFFLIIFKVTPVMVYYFCHYQPKNRSRKAFIFISAYFKWHATIIFKYTEKAKELKHKYNQVTSHPRKFKRLTFDNNR